MIVEILKTIRLSNWIRLWFIVIALCALVSIIVPLVLFVISGMVLMAFFDGFLAFFKKIFKKNH